MFSIIIEPISENQSIEHATLLVHNTENDESKISKVWEFYDEINMEDISICEEVQKGMNCDVYTNGIYVEQYEKTLKKFHQMFTDCLL